MNWHEKVFCSGPRHAPLAEAGADRDGSPEAREFSTQLA